MVDEKTENLIFVYFCRSGTHICRLTQEQFLLLGNWLEFPETPRNAFMEPFMVKSTFNDPYIINYIPQKSHKWSLWQAEAVAMDKDAGVRKEQEQHKVATVVSAVWFKEKMGIRMSWKRSKETMYIVYIYTYIYNMFWLYIYDTLCMYIYICIYI